jgi:hypothetical protein
MIAPRSTAGSASYAIHGVVARVVTEGTAMREAAATLLAGFPTGDRADRPSVEIEYHSIRSRDAVPIDVPAGARTIWPTQGSRPLPAADEPVQIALSRAESRLFLDLGALGLLIIDYATNRAEGFVVDRGASIDALASVIRFGLAEVLRSSGLYSIHAAAAERQGQAVLVVGASGRGKTTTLLALLRVGYRLLSDDHPLLREGQSEAQILSFPTRINVTETTIALVPELAAAGQRLRAGNAKRWFTLDDLFPGQLAQSARAGLLLFPEVIDWPRTVIEPVRKSRALEGLLRESLLVLDREIAAHQMAALSKLVAVSQTYRARLGADFLEVIPTEIGRLLAEVARA